jgi:hypothetical protein
MCQPRESVLGKGPAVSPNTSFPVHESPQNAITQLVLAHPRVTFDVGRDTLVIAIKDELLVRKSIRLETPRLNEALSKIARNSGYLGQPAQSSPREDESGEQPSEASPADDVEIWHLTNPDDNSIDQARRLRALAQDQCVKTHHGPSSMVPAVSPNHVCVVSSWEICPATPPIPTPPPPGAADFVEPSLPGATATVVIIDTGYIYTTPPNAALDERVVAVQAGEWLDTTTDPATWQVDPPDQVDADHDGRLDGVAGHGTFIAGIVAHHARQARITVVGERHDCMPLAVPPDPVDQKRLFCSEIDIARALLQHADADVISCGFAFPTLDDYPSIPFTEVMRVLTGPDAPRPGVAVVAPAGNEASACPFWPAAHPDVIGVAATNRSGGARASFSNWGPWANCCARGQDVRSTFVDWLGPIEGEPLTDIDQFVGWAIWSGTSFSTPKVSAAIARLVAESDGTLLPIAAYELLLSGGGGVAVTPVTDVTLSPFPGVTLPHFHLG